MGATRAKCRLGHRWRKPTRTVGRERLGFGADHRSPSFREGRSNRRQCSTRLKLREYRARRPILVKLELALNFRDFACQWLLRFLRFSIPTILRFMIFGFVRFLEAIMKMPNTRPSTNYGKGMLLI